MFQAVKNNVRLMSKLNNSQSIWLVHALLLLGVLKSPEYVTFNS